MRRRARSTKSELGKLEMSARMIAIGVWATTSHGCALLTLTERALTESALIVFEPFLRRISGVGQHLDTQDTRGSRRRLLKLLDKV